MRRVMAITALASFLLCLLGGYYVSLWMGGKDAKTTTGAESLDVVQNAKEIDSRTKLIYQYYYTKDGATKEKIETAPAYLQGLTRTQLESVYEGWQVVYFSPIKVILRCSIEGASNEVFLLGEDNGYLAVFYEDADRKLHLRERTDLPLSALPEGEARQIREGMEVTGEENLAKLLSDYTS